MNARTCTMLFVCAALGCGAPHAADDQAHESGGAQHADMPAPSSEEAKPGELAPGHAAVRLNPGQLQAFGVKTERVERRAFTRDIRATGIVRADERLQRHIHVKFEGFVERVFVNFVGRKVRKGEALLSVYSPDLLAAETELVQAYGARDRPHAGPFAESDRAQTDALIQAARARLALLDVPESELARLERTRKPRRTLIIRSPLAGTVIERNVVDGMRVMPDTPLMVVTDLRNVWVMTDIFEADLGAIQLDDHARISFAGGAAPDREGRVSFISPTLDETTRTAKVRIEVANEDGVVRPGLFASVTIHVETGERLAVPASAVIATGRREIAFVQTEPGRFEPRIIGTASRAGDFVEVTAGLSPGDIVAVSAQFLLDSESQIRGGPAKSPHAGH